MRTYLNRSIPSHNCSLQYTLDIFVGFEVYMSAAGVCGKRAGRFEETFGSAAPNKRPRRSGFGSSAPTHNSETGSELEEQISVLLRLYPALNRELVETVLNTHNDGIEDALENLHVLSLGGVRKTNESESVDPAIPADADCTTLPDGEPTQLPGERLEDIQDSGSMFDLCYPTVGSGWVDTFVHEMMSATDIEDARGRAARILGDFERSIMANSKASKELEHASLRKHLENLLSDNQILKRAVAIQHERNLEQEEKTREVQQLKHVISQYQEQLRTLELSNHTLKLHLQQAQESSSIPWSWQFHPDIF